MKDPGVYRELSEIEYREDQSLAKSDLDHFVSGKPKAGRHLLIGSVLHTLALQGPEAAKALYVTCDEELDLRNKAGRKIHDNLELITSKKVLKPSERAMAVSMFKALMAHGDAKRAIDKSKGNREISIFHTLKGFNHQSKSRLDMVIPGSCILDIKTTSYLNRDEFQQAIFDYGYAVQAAYYTSMWQAAANEWLPFIFVCVSKRSPFSVWMQPVSWYHIHHGRKWYNDIYKLWSRYSKVRDATLDDPDLEIVSVHQKEQVDDNS